MEDIDHLIERNSKFGRQWRKIAIDFEGKSARQCAYMYDKISSSGTYTKFNRVDDIFLLDLVKLHGYNWTLIQTKMQKFSLIQLKNRYNKVLLSKIFNNNRKRKITTCKLYKVCFKKKETNKQEVNNSAPIVQTIHNGKINSEIFEPNQIDYSIRKEDVEKVNQEIEYHSFDKLQEELTIKVNSIFNKLRLILKTLLEENKKIENKYQCKELRMFNNLFIQKMKRLLLNYYQISKSNSLKNILELIKNQLLLIQLGKINSKLYRTLTGLLEALDLNTVN